MSIFINGYCAQCGRGLAIKGDGTYTIAHLPGKPGEPLIFCGPECQQEWAKRHCAWCGVSDKDTLLTSTAVRNGVHTPFCEVEHKIAWENAQAR